MLPSFLITLTGEANPKTGVLTSFNGMVMVKIESANIDAELFGFLKTNSIVSSPSCVASSIIGIVNVCADVAFAGKVTVCVVKV